MDKKRGQGRWEQGVPGWYSSKSAFLVLSQVLLQVSALCTHCRWTMPLWPCESKLNHLQSLANGGCGTGGVTDRHVIARPQASQYCGIMGDGSTTNSTRKGSLLVLASSED